MPHTKDDDKKKQDHNAERQLRNTEKRNAEKRGERQFSKKNGSLIG